ncbi:MAG: hypothetical protein F6K24_06870 [Okeania sp. SIO2D1]|nr:hypothetical protein [Okeania sp. SIO2D1]
MIIKNQINYRATIINSFYLCRDVVCNVPTPYSLFSEEFYLILLQFSRVSGDRQLAGITKTGQ